MVTYHPLPKGRGILQQIKQALIQVTNDPSDFFTAEDEIANKIQDNFFDCSYASLVEEE